MSRRSRERTNFTRQIGTSPCKSLAAWSGLACSGRQPGSCERWGRKEAGLVSGGPKHRAQEQSRDSGGICWETGSRGGTVNVRVLQKSLPPEEAGFPVDRLEIDHQGRQVTGMRKDRQLPRGLSEGRQEVGWLPEGLFWVGMVVDTVICTPHLPFKNRGLTRQDGPE